MKVFVIYDSFALACKANVELQRAAINIGGAFQWNICPCPTRTILEEATASQALAEAQDAHLLLFALDDSTPFSNRIETWLEGWALSRTVADSAIGILSNSNDIRKLRAYIGLLDFAERRGLGLVLSRLRFPEFNVSGSVLASKLGQPNSPSTTLDQGS